jgi:beta-lactamase regulating signal transducer with metallopeptidase domain
MSRMLLMNWGVHLLHAAWQASAASILLIAITRAMPRLSSRLRYALLVLALVKFALPPMLPLPTGLFSALPRVGSRFFWPIERVVAFAPPRVLECLLLIHAIGAVVVVASLSLRVLRLRLLVRRSQPANESVALAVRQLCASWRLPGVPRVVVTRETAIPFVCGAIRPVIVLPPSIAEDAMTDVIAHELGHISGDDTRFDAFQALLGIVWWWNPIFWLLASELRRVREERCDDFVLARGLSSPRDYSLSILSVAEGVPLRARVAMASPIHALEPRLRRIADAGIVRALRLRTAEIIALLTAAAVLAPGLRLF